MKVLATALAIALATSVSFTAYAETATTPTTPPSTTTTPPAKKARSAKSIECSKLADAKGLHGKKRREFRAKCKKGEPTE